MPHESERALAIPKTRHDTDLATCHEILVRGSRSFWVASWLLPRRMRPPAAAFYAFCRAADDLVDDGDAARGLEILRRRVDAIFAGRPHDHAADRAFSIVVHRYAIPRATIDALLEGFAWDAESRTYETLDDVLAYGVRVASSVGVVMTLLMGRRDHTTLARACDLGAAMQLTNIARDVGEDAHRGRVYLPLSWLRASHLDLEAFLSAPAPSEPVRAATLRLLDEADRLYTRAHAGIEMLPADCRPAIRAASAIYRDIGRVIRRRRGDGITSRARVSGLRKVWLVGRAAFATSSAPLLPDRAAPPLAPAVALVEAVARPDRGALPSGAHA